MRGGRGGRGEALHGEQGEGARDGGGNCSVTETELCLKGIGTIKRFYSV